MERHGIKNLSAAALGILFVLCVLALSFPSLSRAGVMTDLGTLEGTDSVAYAINDGGRIVGSSYTSTGATHAFLHADGAMTDLGTLPGGDGSEAYAINNAGQIVGAGFISPEQYHAFLYSEGKMTDIGTLGGDNSTANAINSNGQIVGGSHILTDTVTSDITAISHAFLYSEGKMTDIGTLGGRNSFATGINDGGQVVGWSDTALGESHAFLYSGGQMIDLGTLGGYESLANAINSKGQVVGWSSLPTGAMHAFLFYDGAMTDLGTLGGDNSHATGINDAGQIVGWSDTARGESHAFLYSGGKMKDLGALRGGHVSNAAAINNLGQVVGWSLNSSDFFRAVVYSPGPSSISTRPSSLSFGPVKKDGSLVREITVRNYGSGNLILGSITLSGPDENQFLAVNDCSAPLIPRGTCTITVTFRPTSYGLKNATLTIPTNDPRKLSYTIALKADCPYPRMFLTPSFIDFGRVPQTQTSGPKTVKITNTSLSDLSINSIELSDNVSFSRTDPCSTVVKGKPCTIELTFKPQGAGPTSGFLTIVSDDQRARAIVRLQGKGK